MPVTIIAGSMKYKDGNGEYQDITGLKGDPGPQGAPGQKGDKGDPGDPTELIDDAAGSGDTDKVWSADKSSAENQALASEIQILEPAATSSDVGKFLKAKTVSGGKVTEYEFGSASGGGGTSDYSDLTNKPSINGVTLAGNKSLADLGVASASDVNAKYTKPPTGIPASDMASGAIPDVTVKADKVTSATSGNFAALDGNGNLTDSGHKHSDYLTSHQDISGLVSGPDSSTSNAVAIYDGLTGKRIKNSGYTIGKSVPSDAVFTDTTYESKTAASGGTDVSLVTTGEKYTWNNKGTYSKPSGGIPASDLADGVVTGTVTVSGSTPSITGTANHRYLCGTVTEISITPPQSGIIDVVFTAGSNCVLTLPNTVKLPGWFDSTSLDTGTTYEINIADGVYGVVMAWT